MNNKNKTKKVFTAMSPYKSQGDLTGQAGGVIKKKKTVFVAMSGGVDSSVAALLLKRKGYEVIGVFMRCFNLDGCAEKDAEDARRVAEKLKIPFYVWDFEEEYKKKVVDYMVSGYRKGITPNPDVMCNREIKFGLFLEKALAIGADYVATGHYVRLKKTKNPVFGEALVEFQNNLIKPELVPNIRVSNTLNLSNAVVDNFKSRGPTGNQTPETQVPTLVSDHPGPTAYLLYQAKDQNKDQSYFLWTLTQEQLKHCLFPIGDYLKSEVRAIARKAGLSTAAKKDSQGICFLGKVSLGDFLRKYISEKNGEVLSLTGEKIGEHKGSYFYTIGQRHGLALSTRHPAGDSKETKPLYVAGKNIKRNTITVAEGDDNPALYKKEVELKGVNFIFPQHSNILKNVGISGLKVLARVRYRQPLAQAFLILRPSQGLRLIFDKPVKFVAPGQSAVFYSKKGEMLGGGVIK